jgi:hypothetical protein
VSGAPGEHAPTPDARGRPRLVIGPGARVGGCVLESLLGQGGMGQVWRARDAALGRLVAVKLLPISVRDEGRERSLRELEAASRVRHPNIVDVHAAGEGPGYLFLVMDLVPGASLDQLLSRGPLEPRQAATVVLGLTRALAALHAVGVIHRDVKPANLIVSEDGIPRLMDFGVARLPDAQPLTQTFQLLGTPLYMAPEQLMGARVDERADVYGAGAVLYEALTGHPPAEKDDLVSLAVAKEAPPAPPSSLCPRVDARLDAVTLRALAPLATRYASAAELRDDLERWLAGEPVRALFRRDRLPLALGGLGAAVLLVAASVLAVRRGPDGEPRAVAVARARQALAARASTSPSLAQLDVEEARALLLEPATTPDGDEAQELARWVGLVDLARGARAQTSVPDAAERGPAQAVRGALLRASDPTAAVSALDQARRGGLDAIEVRRWWLQALAARGVEAKVEATARLAELERDPELAALEPAAAARLEAACLLALGRPREASAALARASQGAEAEALAWAIVVAEARELVVQGRVAAAWQLLAPRTALPARRDRRRRSWAAWRSSPSRRSSSSGPGPSPPSGARTSSPRSRGPSSCTPASSPRPLRRPRCATLLTSWSATPAPSPRRRRSSSPSRPCGPRTRRSWRTRSCGSCSARRAPSTARASSSSLAARARDPSWR